MEEILTKASQLCSLSHLPATSVVCNLSFPLPDSEGEVEGWGEGGTLQAKRQHPSRRFSSPAWVVLRGIIPGFSLESPRLLFTNSPTVAPQPGRIHPSYQNGSRGGFSSSRPRASGEAGAPRGPEGEAPPSRCSRSEGQGITCSGWGPWQAARSSPHAHGLPAVGG